ncbi:MAG: exodeoxyribonuclease VII small subunit [Eubacteriales bacterium]|nr:exodeoxyribonuclease VII small subunit [Eubacteriales bacterium]
MAKESKKFVLEDAFKEIEHIITQLESDDVSLKDSIALYSDGTKLLTQCKEELTGIEKEMIIITESMNEPAED